MRNFKDIPYKYFSIIWEKYKYHCIYCFKKCRITGSWVNNLYISLDHKIPRSRGGTNELTNLVVACRGCNSTKNAKTHQEFRRLMKTSIYQNQFKLKLRKKSVELYKKGLSTREIGLIVGKSHQWVSKVIRHELPEAFKQSTS
jgi:hypothetical protein